jgi:hypothetical protein
VPSAVAGVQPAEDFDVLAGGAKLLADLPVLGRGRSVSELLGDTAQRPQIPGGQTLVAGDPPESLFGEALVDVVLLALGERVEQDEEDVGCRSGLVHPGTIGATSEEAGGREHRSKDPREASVPKVRPGRFLGSLSNQVLRIALGRCRVERG